MQHEKKINDFESRRRTSLLARLLIRLKREGGTPWAIWSNAFTHILRVHVQALNET
jgi:hypothetical protein